MDDKTKKAIKDHILNHHDGFPTTKAKLVEACEGMSEFDDKTKKWFADTLPEGDYEKGEDVLKALGME